MNTQMTYALAVLQVVFGILGLVMGWIETDVATTLILTALSVFGLTRQNVKLGRAFGAKI